MHCLPHTVWWSVVLQLAHLGATHACMLSMLVPSQKLWHALTVVIATCVVFFSPASVPLSVNSKLHHMSCAVCCLLVRQELVVACKPA